MKQLESKLMELNAKLPQLPENFKASLAKWLWVLVIIAIVINIMGIMTILGIGALDEEGGGAERPQAQEAQ